MIHIIVYTHVQNRFNGALHLHATYGDVALPYGGIGRAGGRRGKGSLEVVVDGRVDMGKDGENDCMCGVEVAVDGRGDMGKVGGRGCMCGS